MSKNENHIIFTAKDRGTFSSLHKMLKFVGREECSKNEKDLKIKLPLKKEINEGILRWCKFNNVEFDYEFDSSSDKIAS
jgi:hypothetical protein